MDHKSKVGTTLGTAGKNTPKHLLAAATARKWTKKLAENKKNHEYCCMIMVADDMT